MRDFHSKTFDVSPATRVRLRTTVSSCFVILILAIFVCNQGKFVVGNFSPFPFSSSSRRNLLVEPGFRNTRQPTNEQFCVSSIWNLLRSSRTTVVAKFANDRVSRTLLVAIGKQFLQRTCVVDSHTLFDFVDSLRHWLFDVLQARVFSSSTWNCRCRNSRVHLGGITGQKARVRNPR